MFRISLFKYLCIDINCFTTSILFRYLVSQSTIIITLTFFFLFEIQQVHRVVFIILIACFFFRDWGLICIFYVLLSIGFFTRLGIFNWFRWIFFYNRKKSFFVKNKNFPFDVWSKKKKINIKPQPLKKKQAIKIINRTLLTSFIKNKKTGIHKRYISNPSFLKRKKLSK